jgi:hypothetical protein
MHVLKCVANTGVLYSSAGSEDLEIRRCPSPRRPCGRVAPYARHSLKIKRRPDPSKNSVSTIQTRVTPRTENVLPHADCTSTIAHATKAIGALFYCSLLSFFSVITAPLSPSGRGGTLNPDNFAPGFRLILIPTTTKGRERRVGPSNICRGRTRFARRRRRLHPPAARSLFPLPSVPNLGRRLVFHSVSHTKQSMCLRVKNNVCRFSLANIPWLNLVGWHILANATLRSVRCG